MKCAIHDVEEPFVKGQSTGCFECNHSYINDEALLAAWQELAGRFTDQFASMVKMATTDPDRVMTAGDVPFCPLCLHDW